MSNNITKFNFNPFVGNFDEISVFSPPAGTTVLVAGTVTVSAPAVDSNSIIFLTGQNISGTVGELSIINIVNGVSFDITSSSNTDTRTVAWLIFELTPAVSGGPWLSLAFSGFDG